KDGLTERYPHTLGNNSPDRIRNAARAARHDHGDGAGRVDLSLCASRGSDPETGSRCSQEMASGHYMRSPQPSCLPSTMLNDGSDIGGQEWTLHCNLRFACPTFEAS